MVHIQWAIHLQKFEQLLENRNFQLVVSLRGRLVNVTPFVNEEIASMYRLLFPKVDAFHAVSKTIVENAAEFGANKDSTIVIKPAIDEQLLKFK